MNIKSNFLILLFFYIFIIFKNGHIVDSCGKRKVGRGLIVGGRYAVRGEFPWVAALINRDNLVFCGGTLLTKKKVLTAAHCIHGKDDLYKFEASDLRVILGGHNTSADHEIGRKTINVTSINVHPDWNTTSSSFDADIAMLTLANLVPYNDYIRPICLIMPGSNIENIDFGHSVGYGKSQDTTKLVENILKVVHTPIQKSNEQCFYTSDVLLKMSSNRTFCGGSRDGAGVCTGDSGNGLFVQKRNVFYIRGIVSSSMMTTFGCDVGHYAIYTHVLKFNEWISNQVNPSYIKHLYHTSDLDSPLDDADTKYVVSTKQESTTIAVSTLEEVECGTLHGYMPLIHNGSLTASKEYPWNAVLMTNDGDLFCGGTVVSSKHVLTAAHCIKGKRNEYEFNKDDIYVMLGVHNFAKKWEKGRNGLEINTIFVHPDWNVDVDHYEADIAVLELVTEINFNKFVRPICIPDFDSDVASATRGIAVGFGITENGTVSDVARRLEIPIYDYKNCTRHSPDHRDLAGPRTFCGGWADGSGVCSGDSGNGVYVIDKNAFYLRGITSASFPNQIGECDLEREAVFTDIPKFYGWIKSGGRDKNASNKAESKRTG